MSTLPLGFALSCVLSVFAADQATNADGPQRQPAPASPSQTQSDASAPKPSVPAKPRTLAESLANLQRYFDDSGIRFDTKGVEFGPWVRRFLSQVKRNWEVPAAVKDKQGDVVVSFTVHKDGSLTDVTIVTPSRDELFNSAAKQALVNSNPTHPLPEAYPDEMMVITVTFYYNETPSTVTAGSHDGNDRPEESNLPESTDNIWPD